MTGFKSKKAAALDEEGFYTAYPKEEDDDTQVYKDHGDLLTIAYQSGYHDGKKAAQVKVEGSLHVVCQCDKCKAQPAQEPVAWVTKRNVIVDALWEEEITFSEFDDGGDPVYYTPQQRPWAGLTHDERYECVHGESVDAWDIAEAVETRLKWKNI